MALGPPFPEVMGRVAPELPHSCGPRPWSDLFSDTAWPHLCPTLSSWVPSQDLTEGGGGSLSMAFRSWA